MSLDEQDAVMTVPEVAGFLKMAEGTVRRLARNGDIPAKKVGGEWRFLRKSIEAYLEQPFFDHHAVPHE